MVRRRGQAGPAGGGRPGAGARQPRGVALAVFLAAAVFAALAALPAASEVQTSVTVSGYAALVRAGDEAALAALAKTRLDLQSRGNANVRGFLQLDGWIADGVVLGVPRAYLKVRFPWFRLTLGKSRLSWGEGFVFNAGDVIFGSLSPLSGDLTAASLREETAWLGAVYVPLGAFSFLEAVVLPYAPPLLPGLAAGLTALLSPVSARDLAGGVRAAGKLLGITAEGGYFYDGRAGEHRPYAGLHGHLLVDWSLAASLAIPDADPVPEEWVDWLALSAGLFSLLRPAPGWSLTLRLEAALRPGALWEEAAGAAALPAGYPGAPVYGLYLFPEVAVAPTDTLSLQLRALISPVDRSALAVASLSWNVYQGFTAFTHLSAMVGDADDLYGWDRDRGIAWTLGAEFVF